MEQIIAPVEKALLKLRSGPVAEVLGFRLIWMTSI